jgi:hypothetical protein
VEKSPESNNGLQWVTLKVNGVAVYLNCKEKEKEVRKKKRRKKKKKNVFLIS